MILTFIGNPYVDNISPTTICSGDKFKLISVQRNGSEPKHDPAEEWNWDGVVHGINVKVANKNYNLLEKHYVVFEVE